MTKTGTDRKLPFFERYLTFWVLFCIVAGVIAGRLFPAGVSFLSAMEISNVNIPVAVLIWLMIYPMMVQIDFGSIIKAGKSPKGLIVTLVVNWLIKPFTMAIFAVIFLKYAFAAFIDPALAREYIAGAILLGAAPCTAMVFVWSYLTKGNPAYTLVQVAVNDLVILVAFVPIVKFLLGVNQIVVPYDTLIYSTILFVVIPLSGGYLSRVYLLKAKGPDWFDNVFLKALKPVTIIGLLLTLIILFAFQGNIIISNPFHILLIAVPLAIQTYFIFFIGYLWSKKWRLPHNIASPAAMIGASNFFELSVAVAISLFGLKSGAALATVVGVLTEVPIMLSLVYFSNKTRDWFGHADIKKAVRESYSKMLNAGSSCGCSGSCCGPDKTAAEMSKAVGYSDDEINAAPQGANLGFGCGNPVAIASLKEGETVLDLGSGAGFDAFLAAQKVGPKGKVIGVDMTPDMIKKAKENASKESFSNVEFRLGEIEKLPVDTGSVDVIISNCVINLSPEKKKVFSEAFRVLKTGGRLMISDLVLTKDLPGSVKGSIEAYVGCISGAVMKEEYLDLIKKAGFRDIEIASQDSYPTDIDGASDCVASIKVSARK